MDPTVRIYVITYRRPKLLVRSLRSVLAQTYPGWVAEVVNDDPEDSRVAEIIEHLGDPRITLSDPPRRRGGTGNFNYAFRTVAEPFASILEDDNWWEPDFLASMIFAMENNPKISIACGNERIWIEQPDLSWVDTGKTIWPVDRADQLIDWNASDKCGTALLCNSSMLFRTAGSERWRTPAEIPIDVTEHFRERVVPHPFLLVSNPLVNYAQTLRTHRSKDQITWNQYQLLLVGSVFALSLASNRGNLAKGLWQKARTSDPFLATTLLSTGWLVEEARELWNQGRWTEKLRFLAGRLGRPRDTLILRNSFLQHKAVWGWLQQGPFAAFMRTKPMTGGSVAYLQGA
jgi:glycosyltransferase involved in cell wall biosynthesis